MKSIFLVLPFICSLTLFAQDEAPPVYYGASAVPPSPTSASLGKYGDVPVSLYTGVPEISIPLYSVVEGNLSIPISLSYHSQGFKVEDVASWVGLGWSLNAGGVITRSVKGVPDDFNGDNWGSNIISPASGYAVGEPSNGFLTTATSIENLYNTNVQPSQGATYLPIMLELAGNQTDGEPDIFYFNFPGGSGQFMFDKNGNVQFLSQQNYKITYNRNASGDLIKFEITDGNGNIYTFDQIESTKTISLNGIFTYAALTDSYINSEICGGLNTTESAPFNSSWYLSKIKNATYNKEINLTYVSENQRNISGLSVQYLYINSTNNTPDLLDNRANYSYNVLQNATKRLTEINWSNGKIVFDANLIRDDVNDACIYSTGQSSVQSNALTNITIKDAANNIIKKYNLNQSYFTVPGATTNLSFHKKLKLVTLTEQNSALSLTNPPYSFEYDETVSLAPRFSQRQDYWGYLKSTTAPSNVYAPKVYMYPNDPIDNDFLSEFSIYQKTANSGEVIHGNYDRTTETSAIKMGIIKKITYPTGGSTYFEFEPHDFYLQNQNRTGGGLRIKTITDYDGLDHDKDIIKNYSYKQSLAPTLSSGKVLTLPVFAKRRACYNNNMVEVSNNSIAPLGSTMGSHVGYSEVTVEYNGNGKTISKFHLPASAGINQEDCALPNDCIYNRTHSNLYYTNWSTGSTLCLDKTNFPFAENPNYDWNRGALLEELIYDNQNRLVQKTQNAYTIKNYQKIYAFTNKLMTRFVWVLGNGSVDDEIIFRFAKHYYISAWKVLNTSTVYQYNYTPTNSQFVNTTQYFYDNSNHKQVTKVVKQDSKGINHETLYKRCSDFNTSTGFLATLNTQNRLNEVIENESWINNGTTSSLLGASFIEYKDFASQNGNASSQLLPFKTYGLETSVPILSTNFINTTFNGVNFTLDSRFKPLKESNYDNKDNLTKTSIYNAGLKNNSTNIYGHSKNLLIAQVNNATEADCGFTSFESDDYLVFGNYSANIQNDGHCGTKSYSIAPNNFGPGRDYMPSTDAQNKKFILSCWVKTNSNAAGAIGSLVLYSNQFIGSGTIYPNVGGAYVATSIFNTNNVWKYIEVAIDLKAIKIAGGLPLSTNLGIRSFVWNTGTTVNIQVDDFRFYPKEARMASYTYVPAVGASSISDENSNCQYYEYDSFGRLKIVKDQNGKILERTEYNYKP